MQLALMSRNGKQSCGMLTCKNKCPMGITPVIPLSAMHFLSAKHLKSTFIITKPMQ
jgi:hypothetical protein